MFQWKCFSIVKTIVYDRVITLYSTLVITRCIKESAWKMVQSTQKASRQLQDVLSASDTITTMRSVAREALKQSAASAIHTSRIEGGKLLLQISFFS